MSDTSKTRRTMRLFSLDGKIALVTGGSGIYGEHIVRALAEAGAHVVIASRHVAKCEELAGTFGNEKLQAEAGTLDLTSESSIRELRDKIISNHHRLDVLVNNAVARTGGDLRHVTAEQWETAMKVNSTGLF